MTGPRARINADRTLLSLAIALGLTLGSALPTTAAVLVPLRIDCGDGDSLELTVDLGSFAAAARQSGPSLAAIYRS